MALAGGVQSNTELTDRSNTELGNRRTAVLRSAMATGERSWLSRPVLRDRLAMVWERRTRNALYSRSEGLAFDHLVGAGERDLGETRVACRELLAALVG